MNKVRSLLLAVAAAAMAFTFSCSGDDGGDGGSSSSGGGLGGVSSSSEATPSSSSVAPSSSSVVPSSSSSSSSISSSSRSDDSSSSSALPSSSSAAPSSSSNEPSSSSALPSSSSVAPSSSSSSSSSLSSSSSFAIVSNCSANFRTVTIGTQVWAAENLNCDVEGSKCYDNDPANCAKYGRLYDWSTAMAFPSSCNSASCSDQIASKHRSICPSGWHIPSNADWDKLFRYVDGTSRTESPYSSATAGTKLKSQTGWDSSSGVVGTNQYGFSALPGGSGYSDGSVYNAGDDGYWWSASEGNSFSAYGRDMHYYTEDAYWNYSLKSYLFSVRCLQD